MDKTKNQRLALSFVLMMGFVITVLFFLLITISINRVKKNTSKSYEEDCQALVESYSYGVSTWIEKQLSEMNMYVNADVLDHGTDAEIASWLTKSTTKRPSSFDYVLYINAQGNSFYDSGKTGFHGDRAYYKKITGGETDTVVNDPTIAKATGKPSLLLVRAAYNEDKKVIGMFVGTTIIKTLQDRISNIKIGNEGYAFLLASDGTVIAHQDSTLVMQTNFTQDSENVPTGMTQIAADMINRNSGTGFITNVNGTKEFIVYTPVQNTPWSLAVSIPETQFYATSKSLQKLILSLALSIAAILLLISTMLIIVSIKPLQSVEKTLRGIASGNADLTQRINVKSNNEIGSVVDWFNTFVAKLQSIVTGIKSSKQTLSTVNRDLQTGTEDTAAAITQITTNISNVGTQIESQIQSVDETAKVVNEIAQNIISLERMVESQATGVTQSSAAVQEMIGNIGSVNTSVEKMAGSFTELRQYSQTGIEKQDYVNQRIEQIESQSEMLQEANAAIASIAQQTNLLAMNAAIEAAHAGDAGKGFSVVADEIRKLSETSSEQSKTIGTQLTKIKESIGDVVTASADSSNAFTSVSERIKHTDQLVQQIKNAMQEQQEGSKQVLDSLHAMSESTEAVKAASIGMTDGNQSILDEIKQLQTITDAIRTSMQEMSAGAHKINDTGKELSSVSSRMEESIDQIGRQIDQFKV